MQIEIHSLILAAVKSFSFNMKLAHVLHKYDFTFDPGDIVLGLDWKEFEVGFFAVVMRWVVKSDKVIV